MRNTVQWSNLSGIPKGLRLLAVLLCCPFVSSSAEEISHSKILSRPEVSHARRDALAAKLREITGWRDLEFDRGGALRLNATENPAGSRTARELLSRAVFGERLIVIEDASGRGDVVFCQVVEGRWTRDQEKKPPVHIVLIDFDDFSHVTGDRAALAAFNVGWALLHEIDHVVNGSLDPGTKDQTGECEALLNQMRRESGLAERAEYFYSHFPGTEPSSSMARYVRLPFDRQDPYTRKKQRYWIMWDASLVGGSINQNQIADTR